MIRGLIVGTLSGFVLGFSLKWIEMLMDKKVYILLLNIDFIPILGEYTFAEWIEFAFHLIISLIIGILYVFILEKGILGSWLNKWSLAAVLTFPTLFLYFPLSMLAIKDVPPPTDYLAFLYWVIGHVLYAISLPIIFNLFPKR
ncbi:hypothetical protein [Mangrovibacillus cuniculi]|uniref:DUF1440 domain-containing protein n=1 Tax=Mangrovibacillus cuniculi TaxID=2593652 RepID=A0A7S8HF68_9BACI|nr:hypothetical protein [Mangrovibacillus cuniculi]QPC46206.1 hypothetical protein G8O30_04150 [Mangrovibacillus cuniculi]